ncbi:acyltransferase [Ligilactobacillus sp. WILCCON 0076]|uniref:Acyltransferase n=1 Tax=Ligilactobacillus ubinensis TaxID=2876789 RepID=A0A9X2FKS1_9LACO|nr:acyltransferase [Ligilactobacillus ubinensis]MCP0887180.1 acyltransferase [Ligilactobacillus ubinensis]
MTNAIRKKKRPYLYEVDLMRCIFIFGVLANHTTSEFTAGFSASSKEYYFLLATHLVLHFTRMGFMFITGLVLFLGYYNKPKINYPQFWFKRYKGSGIPYLFWNGFFLFFTAIVAGETLKLNTWFTEWISAVIHGDHFYLYYILVTMQLYLIFPIMVWIYKKTEGHHNLVLTISAIIQFIFLIYTKYIFPYISHDGWPFLLRSYGMFVLSYQFYFMAGAYVSIHYKEVTEFVTKWHKRIYWITAGLAVGTLGLFYYNYYILKLSRHYVNLVHQPYLMIYASFMILSIMSLSLQYAKKRTQPKWQGFAKAVGLSSKLSFGVYLTQTASLALLAYLIDLLKTQVNSIVLLLLLPLGYLIVLGGAWLISYFCYKVPPFGVLVGRPQKLRKRKEKDYDKANA